MVRILLIFKLKYLNYESTNILIDKDIQSKGLLTPLHLFVRNNLETQDEEKNKKIDILYKVITETKSANINAQDEKGMTPLHYAVSKNNHKCAHLLLNTEGIKLNVQDKNLLTPLHLAVMNGNDQMAYLLIHHTDTEGLLAQATPDSLLIHMCCKNKVEKLELVKYILDKLRTSSTEENNLLDTVFNLKDNNQQTLLHIAIQNKHLGVVECLINDYNIDKEMCGNAFNSIVKCNFLIPSSLKLILKLKNASLVIFRYIQRPGLGLLKCLICLSSTILICMPRITSWKMHST